MPVLPPPARSLEVLTWNTWFGFYDWAFVRMEAHDTTEERRGRRERLLDLLAGDPPDILALQEVCPLISLSRRLHQRLGGTEVHKVANGGWRVGETGLPLGFVEGQLLWARSGLTLDRRFARPLSGAWGSLQADGFGFQWVELRCLLGARLVGAGRGPLWLFSVHTHFGPPADLAWKERLERVHAARGVASPWRCLDRFRLERRARLRWREAENALRWARTVAGDAPCLVMGDFNLEPTEAPWEPLLARHGFVDTLPVDAPGTWRPDTNPLAARSARVATRSSLGELCRLYDEVPRRVDYVLVHDPAEFFTGWEAQVTRPGSGVPSPEGQGSLVSDHEAVKVRLQLAP